jgi:hypothetical protein
MSCRSEKAFQRTRSNFTLSSPASASGGRLNATRDGAYSETVCSAYGSSAAAASDAVLLDTDREDQTSLPRYFYTPGVRGY